MKAVEGWKKESLGHVAQLIMGQSPDSKYYSEEENGLPFLQGCAEFQARFPKHKLYCSQTKKFAHAESILFSVRAPVGKINIADRDYIIGSGLAAISGIDVDQSFIEHCLIYNEPNFRNASQGSTFEAINSTELKVWPIHYPTSKPEQSKIAEILSTVDRAIEQTEVLITKQQRIKTGLMQDLLTRGIDEHGNLRSEQTHQFKDSPLGRIPVEWDVADLNSELKSIKRGPSLSTNSERRGIIYLTSDNISETGDLIWQTVKHLDARAESLSSILEIGDIILNCVNSEAQIGKVGFVDKLIDITTTGFNNFGLMFKENEIVPKFAFYYLSQKNFQNSLRKKIKPAINQSSFSSTDIADLPFLKPSLEEQQFIADKIDSVSNNVQRLSKTLSKATKIKTALMQDLLTGKKRVTPLLTALQEASG